MTGATFGRCWPNKSRPRSVWTAAGSVAPRRFGHLSHLSKSGVVAELCHRSPKAPGSGAAARCPPPLCVGFSPCLFSAPGTASVFRNTMSTAPRASATLGSAASVRQSHRAGNPGRRPPGLPVLAPSETLNEPPLPSRRLRIHALGQNPPGGALQPGQQRTRPPEALRIGGDAGSPDRDHQQPHQGLWPELVSVAAGCWSSPR